VPDDLLGKKVKCPACKSMFLATVRGLKEAEETAPAPEEERPSKSTGLTPSRREAPHREEEDGEDSSRPSRRGSARPKRLGEYQAHRGTIILVLGILAIVTGLHIVLGPIAWIMGNNDLKEIHAGRMDREGEGMTNIGRILGMVATILGIVALVVGCIAVIIWLIFVVGFLGLAAGASGH
jgi:hypothetical protein